MSPPEPAASRYAFVPEAVAAAPAGEELLGVGADLEPGTVLSAYRAGLFPMPLSTLSVLSVRRSRIGWWSPDPRGVLPLSGLVVSRSLRRACRHFEIRVDTAYDEVVAGCADRRRAGAWITKDVVAAYRRLYELGWVHSVEAWTLGADGRDRLAGGLYGISIGGLFAGESMFHRDRDASKVALVGLVDLLRSDGVDRLLDVQWATDHLQSLGVVVMPRPAYLSRLAAALVLPPPSWENAGVRFSKA